MKVLITGATGGIGKALIDIFYRNGWEILAVGRNRNILKELKGKYRDRLNTYYVDLGNEKSIDEFFKELEGEEINLLINGAGIGELGYFEDIPYENEKISRNKQILTLKKLYPELNKVSTVESYKITKKRRNGNLQRWDGDLLLTFRIKQKKRG